MVIDYFQRERESLKAALHKAVKEDVTFPLSVRDPWFQEAFKRELKTQLRVSWEGIAHGWRELKAGLDNAKKRLLVMKAWQFDEEGDQHLRTYYFPFLRSAYFRGAYDPAGPSNYGLDSKGQIWKFTEEFPETVKSAVIQPNGGYLHKVPGGVIDVR